MVSRRPVGREFSARCAWYPRGMRFSVRALAILHELRALTYAPRVDADKAERVGDLLRDLAQTGEWWALRSVGAIAFSTEELVAEEAIPPIAYLVGLIPPWGVPRLDRALRQSGWYLNLFASAWWELRPRELPMLDRNHPACAPLLRLSMCHPSGWVRETAIRRSVEAPSDGDLPFLLVRTRDWVKQVRAAAVAASARFFAPEHAATVVAILPL